MSITMAQSMCDHNYNRYFYCNKCGYTNIIRKHIETLAVNLVGKPVDFISDIHLEHWCSEINPQSPKLQKQMDKYIEDILVPKTSNILIIAGDLGHYNKQIQHFLMELKKYYKHIIIVPGNHDYYLISNRQIDLFKNSECRIADMKSFCENNEGLYFLDGNVIVIDGIEIGGLGMWHDYSYMDNFDFCNTEKELYDYWKKIMNDAKYIYGRDGKNFKIDIGYGYKEHITSFDPLKMFYEQKEKMDKIINCAIMVTHYGPVVPENLKQKYIEDPNTTFYYFDGRDDIKRIAPKFWVHGHTHGSYSTEVDGTEVLCNTIGYPTDNTYNEIKTLFI